MERIERILSVPTQGAYYYEDVELLQTRSIPEEERAFTLGKTPGFHFAREIAETVSFGIQTTSGTTYWGDCVGVSYSGKSGRHQTFRHDSGTREIEERIRPLFVGKVVTSFRELASLIPVDIHPAIQYGVSQCLINTVSTLTNQTPCELICEEWKLEIPKTIVPLQGSSGNNRKINADKMILNRLEALPHSQIDDIPKQLGLEGEILLDYARWLQARLQKCGGPDYLPTIHLDVHGAIGKIFNLDMHVVALYLQSLEKAVAPYPLRMESVVLGNTKNETIELLCGIRQELANIGSNVRLVADEWANTLSDIRDFASKKACDMVHIKMPDMGNLVNSIDAVIECKKLGMNTLLGGSCIETDISTRISTQVALATQPTVFLIKPGMGIDEGIMFCRNEMKRTLALLARS